LKNTLNALAALFIVVDLYYEKLLKSYGTTANPQFNELNIKFGRQPYAVLFSSQGGIKRRPLVF
jgi:hypothetical protein